MFQELAELDFPCNDQSWLLMRRSMLEALQVGGVPSITPFPVVLIDDEIRDANDPRIGFTEAGQDVDYALGQPELVNRDFVVLGIAPLEGVFELEASGYRSMPGAGIWMVDHDVLREPEGGFPPVFRLAEVPTTLFITQAARERLKAAGVRDPVYRAPAGPPREDEVDVAVFL